MSTPTPPVTRSGNELVDIVEPWLYGLLAGDAQLMAATNGNIVGTLAAGEVEGPYVWFEAADVRDRVLPGGTRIWVDATYEIVAAMATASWLDVKPIAARMLQVLEFAPATVIQTPTGTLEFWRIAPLQYPQTIQGVQYRFLGGRYHVRAYYT